jgi:hypothetical protein
MPPVWLAGRPVGRLRSIILERTSVAHQGVKQNFRFALPAQNVQASPGPS